jgi:hypothetical protein
LSEEVLFNGVLLVTECPFLAEDCLLPGFDEGQLWRKQTLKIQNSAAIYDPKQTPVLETIYPFFPEALLYNRERVRTCICHHVVIVLTAI